MCRVLKIARAGYYAWLHEPESGRTIEDKRLLQLIRFLYDASYGIYGYRRITLDLKELGESCGPNRVLKIRTMALPLFEDIKSIKLWLWPSSDCATKSLKSRVRCEHP
jgi:hypothetical protein